MPPSYATHPFVRDGRLFAHNGVVKKLDVLKSWLDSANRATLADDSDSERIFAYLTATIRATGDLTAGLVAAVTHIAAELPVYALNLLLADPGRAMGAALPRNPPAVGADPAAGHRLRPRPAGGGQPHGRATGTLRRPRRPSGHYPGHRADGRRPRLAAARPG